ncbi:MAG: hypothetical protein GQF41_0616 [Candidatus Rifleibacterium amylolyticum]|nr:MAG: hypothetical protein GQF41_0616 [Candidatus Rifleibacterium amylolyticum]NLF95636.1 hypothetical protein [Candidatus Riflebacteria bacterium]
MRRGIIFLLCAVFMLGFSFSAMAVDMPDQGTDNDGGPYTDPAPAPDPGPDSTDSGDSWDSGSSGGGFDCGGDTGGVLF